MNIQIVNLIEEDFIDYKAPGMFLGFPYCSGKCNEEAGEIVCQNQALKEAKLIDISIDEILERYRKNGIVKSLIFGGMEPFDSFEQMRELVNAFYTVYEYRDPIIIYTGYYPLEIESELRDLYSICGSENIVVKFGRYVPGLPPFIDPILCVKLSSISQYAMKLPDVVEKLNGD